MNVNEVELFYMLALSIVEGVGPRNARKLLEEFGCAENIFLYGPGQSTSHAFSKVFADVALKKQRIFLRSEEELKYVQQQGVFVTTINQPTYPSRLLNCPDAPIVLFYKGIPVLDKQRIVSIVGSRNATAYGRAVCKSLIRELKRYDPVVVSGLAYGIDVIAHQEAVNNGLSTVGVLGHGIDMLYPETHHSLAQTMLEKGGLLTEYFSNTRPERFHFPMRNRIIAGISDVTIVVEAAQKGGALITARCANDYHREVCAIPGNVNQEFSKGCNYLIQSHGATMITCADDLAKIMQWPIPNKGSFSESLPFHNCSVEELELLQFIKKVGPKSLDDLVQLTGQHVSALSILLLQLELKNYISTMPGNTYALV